MSAAATAAPTTTTPAPPARNTAPRLAKANGCRNASSKRPSSGSSPRSTATALSSTMRSPKRLGRRSATAPPATSAGRRSAPRSPAPSRHRPVLRGLRVRPPLARTLRRARRQAHRSPGRATRPRRRSCRHRRRARRCPNSGRPRRRRGPAGGDHRERRPDHDEGTPPPTDRRTPRPQPHPHPTHLPHHRPGAGGLRNVRKSGDGGNRTRVRNRAKSGFYERIRRSDLVPGSPRRRGSSGPAS